MRRATSLQYFKKIILTIFLCVSTFFVLGGPTRGEDLMEKVFDQSMTHEQVADIGDTKDAVGNSIFHESVGVEKGDKRYEFKAVRKEGLLMQNIRLFMRIAVVVAIPLLIINGILLIISVTTGAFAKIKKYIVYIIVGIIIILSSVGILYLIQSGTQGTILKEFSTS